MLTKIKEFITEAINAFRAYSVYAPGYASKMHKDEVYMEEMLAIAKHNMAPIPQDIIDANRRYDIAKSVLPKTLIWRTNNKGELIDEIDYELSVKDAIRLADELIKQLNDKK